MWFLTGSATQGSYCYYLQAIIHTFSITKEP